MGKRTTAELLEEAAELGVEVDEDWGYSDLLSAVKGADVESSEEPEDPVSEPELPDTRSEPIPSRRTFPFDELGRYTGR